MPIYEYRCDVCGERFEEFQSIGATNDNVICPRCGTPKPSKVLSSFSSSGVSDSNGGCSTSSPFTWAS